MNRNTLAVFAVLFASTALAAPPPKLDPSLKIPGVSPSIVKETATVGRDQLVKNIDKLEKKVDMRNPRPSDAELQCLAFTFARITSQAAVLIDQMWSAKNGVPVDMVRAGELQAAARHYSKLEDDWCNGQGGKTERVHKLLKEYYNANAPQAKVSTEARPPIAELPKTRAWFEFLRLGILARGAAGAAEATGSVLMPVIDPRLFMKREEDPAPSL